MIGAVERGEATVEQLREFGYGEITWRAVRDLQFGTGVEQALVALDEVIPEELGAALLPPLDADAAIEQHPEQWPQWGLDAEGYELILTNDVGSHVVEGARGRLLLRTPGEADQEVAESLSDWLWDRVAAFGGNDPRPATP